MLYGPAMPCLDPDKPLTRSELDDDNPPPPPAPTVDQLMAYLARMDPDTPVVLTRDDAPEDGPYVNLDDALADLMGLL